MKLKLIAVAIPAIFMATSAFAVVEGEHSTVNFTGNIVEATCALAADSKDQTVDMGNVSTNVVNWIGTSYGAGERDFSINLEGCDTSIAENAFVTFSGKTNADNSGRETVLTTDGHDTAPSTHVGIQILQDGKPLILDGSSASAPLILTDGDNNRMAFTARYINVYDNPTSAGPANASVNFTISYE